MIGLGQKQLFLGNGDLELKRGVINIHRPIHRGVCTDYTKLDALMNHCFYVGLRRAPEESFVCILNQCAVKI